MTRIGELFSGRKSTTVILLVIAATVAASFALQNDSISHLHMPIGGGLVGIFLPVLIAFANRPSGEVVEGWTPVDLNVLAIAGCTITVIYFVIAAVVRTKVDFTDSATVGLVSGAIATFGVVLMAFVKKYAD